MYYQGKKKDYTKKSTAKKYPKKTQTTKKKTYKRTNGSAGSTAGGMIGSTLGGMAGTALGGPAGLAVGEVLGGLAGSMIGEGIQKYFTGMGDYEIKANSLLVGAQNNQIFNRTNDKLGGTVFNKTEYITDVVSSSVAGEFKLQTWDFNAGNPDLFAWLSQCSSNWQQYIVEGCYIEYRPFSGNALNSTNTALGAVTLAAQYNCNDPDFESRQEMEGQDYTISIIPSQGCRYFFECERGRNVLDNLYIASRQNTVQSNNQPVPINDKRFENLCKFSCATTGCQGTSVNLGSLYVTYQIRLLKTKLYDTLGLANANFRCYNLEYSTENPPFGRYNPVYDNIGMTLFQTGSLNGVQFPYNSQALDFLVIVQWAADTAAAVSVTGVLHASPSAILSIDAVGYMSSPPNGSTSTSITRAWYVRSNGNGNPLRIYMDGADAPTLPSGANQIMYMSIIQMPRDYT